MMHPRRKQRKMLEEVPLTPLIDTALTLLIIFMITSPMMHNLIKIDLPEGKSHEKSIARSNITVFIDKDKTLYLNEQQVTLQELISSLSGDMLKNSEGTVCVKGDKDASYGSIIEIVDRLKLVEGVCYVALATKKA